MKRKMIAVAMSVLCALSAVPSVTVFADGQKVVTLGADLSEDQKQAILRYFGVAGQNIETLTITNQDERNHLGSYVPLEQIGSRTYSCALVKPTTSGGIQVKTANLSWVTSNMIATTLSTSGVVNCEVLAASPFEVSGTGALTGILMAYESAVGSVLDETKKEIATQEMITTTTIADNLGQQQAIEIVNESKIQVIQGNDVTTNDIDIIINQIADEKEIELTEEDRQLLQDLLIEISEQDYDYNEMKETLERVEQNVDTSVGDDDNSLIEIEPDENQNLEQELPEDSILMNTDDAALGSGVLFDATDNSALQEVPQTEQAEADDFGFDIISSDMYEDENAGNDTAVVEPEVTPEEEMNPTDSVDDGIVVDGENGEAVLDGENGEAVLDGTEEEGITTGNLEVIPMDTFTFAPQTSEANGYAAVPAGVTMLTVSFQRSDIIAGTGSLTIYNAMDGTETAAIDMRDQTRVKVVPMTAEELLDKNWTEGYKAVILLDEALEANTQYYAALSQDAFATADGIGTSEAADGANWQIQTASYGYRLDQSLEGWKVGDTLTGEMLLNGSEAVYAAIENANEGIAFNQVEFIDNGSISAVLNQAGEASFDISFYDADGNLLNTYSCSIHVEE